MSKSVMNFVRGMGMGLALGCVAGALGNQYMQNNKKGFKRNFGKALKNMSDLVQEVGDMF